MCYFDLNLKYPWWKRTKADQSRTISSRQCIVNIFSVVLCLVSLALHLIRFFFGVLPISIDDLLFSSKISLFLFLCPIWFLQHSLFSMYSVSVVGVSSSSRCRLLLKAQSSTLFSKKRFTAIVLWHSFVSLSDWSVYENSSLKFDDPCQWVQYPIHFIELVWCMISIVSCLWCFCCFPMILFIIHIFV